jgi:hypothetical protein
VVVLSLQATRTSRLPDSPRVRPAPGSIAALLTLVPAVLIGGCDVGEKDEPSPPAVETADPLRKLPQRWSRHANPELGFAIGVPPGGRRTTAAAARCSAPPTARSRGGVPQRLLLVVARREPFATYTAVVAANATQGASAHRDEVLRMLSSLRGRRAE